MYSGVISLESVSNSLKAYMGNEYVGIGCIFGSIDPYYTNAKIFIW